MHTSQEKVFIVPARAIRGFMQRVERSGLVVTRPVRITSGKTGRHVAVYVAKRMVAA